MPLYLDSANLDDVRRAMALGFVAGVTTNPNLIAATGRPGLDVLRDVLALAGGPVFYQVTAPTADARAAQARQASELAPERVIVKIPAALEGFTLAATLSSEGVRCAMTAVSSAAQAYVAAQAGAAYVAPYVNRLTRHLGDGPGVVREIAAVLRGSPTRIIAASLKTPDEVVAAVLAGAHDVTLPLDVILALGEHELSQQAIAEFDAHGVL